MNIHSIVSEPFAENSFIVWLEGNSDAIVIDPGLQPDLILSFLEENGLSAVAILNTHGHADHIAGNETIKLLYPNAPLLIGKNEQNMLIDSEANLSAFFGFNLTSPPADQLLEEGDTITFAGISLEILEVPGHSPGHIAFLHRGKRNHLFSGDILFQGSVGRTDFPGGSFQQLAQGIHAKLFTLPEDTVVYPGHGPNTTIGQERRTNPFVGDGVN